MERWNKWGLEKSIKDAPNHASNKGDVEGRTPEVEIQSPAVSTSLNSCLPFLSLLSLKKKKKKDKGEVNIFIRYILYWTTQNNLNWIQMKFHQVKLWDAAKWEVTPLLSLGLACTSIPAVSSTQSTRRKVRPCSEGSYEINHLKWCPWGVSLKLRRGGVINLGTPGRKCKQPTWFFSALPSLKCLTISLKRKIYLVVLIFLAITFSFPELLQVSSEYQNDNHWSLKMPPTVTM